MRVLLAVEMILDVPGQSRHPGAEWAVDVAPIGCEHLMWDLRPLEDSRIGVDRNGGIALSIIGIGTLLLSHCGSRFCWSRGRRTHRLWTGARKPEATACGHVRHPHRRGGRRQ